MGLRSKSSYFRKIVLHRSSDLSFSTTKIMAESNAENQAGFDPSNMDVDQIRDLLKGMNIDFDSENLNIDEIAESIVKNAMKDSDLGGGGGKGMPIAGYTFGGELHYIFLWVLPMMFIIGFFVYRLISSQRRKQLEKEEKRRKREEKKQK